MMTLSQRRNLATLLAERVRDKADRDDLVGMFTTARLLDQVNKEIQEIRETDEPAAKADKQPLTGARRVFVRG